MKKNKLLKLAIKIVTHYRRQHYAEAKHANEQFIRAGYLNEFWTNNGAMKYDECTEIIDYLTAQLEGENKTPLINQQKEPPGKQLALF